MSVDVFHGKKYKTVLVTHCSDREYMVPGDRPIAPTLYITHPLLLYAYTMGLLKFSSG